MPNHAILTTAKITRIDNARGGRHYQVEGFPEPFPSVTTVLGVINKPALGLLLCALVTMTACVARDPAMSPGSDRSQSDVIDLSPSVEDSSMHADVGDLVSVQVDLPGYGQCQPLKVNDPFGNVVVELTSNETGSAGVKFQGAFFAAVAGEYVVELGHESRNLDCSSRSSPSSAEIQWTVQPR